MVKLRKINDLRKQNLLSWKDLSEKLSISKVGLEKIMSSNSTKIDTLEKIAAFFEVPVAYFFEEYENETNDIRKLRDELKVCQEHKKAIQGNQNVYAKIIADLINFINQNTFDDPSNTVGTSTSLFKMLDEKNKLLLKK